MSKQGERRKAGCEWCALKAQWSVGYFITGEMAKHLIYYMPTR